MSKIKTKRSPAFLFLSQMGGLLFRELAEDISERWPPGVLFTGYPHPIKADKKEFMRIISGPYYERRSHVTKLWSWFKYLFLAFFQCLRTNKETVLFLVFPPFLGLIAYFFKKLRKQRYVVLVYDIFPNALIEFGSLKDEGVVVRLWRFMNRKVWENAEIVFTIGNGMAENLERMFDPSKTSAGKVIIIPNWANTNWIKPLKKEDNEFAQKYEQVGKRTNKIQRRFA